MSLHLQYTQPQHTATCFSALRAMKISFNLSVLAGIANRNSHVEAECGNHDNNQLSSGLKSKHYNLYVNKEKSVKSLEPSF